MHERAQLGTWLLTEYLTWQKELHQGHMISKIQFELEKKIIYFIVQILQYTVDGIFKYKYK